MIQAPIECEMTAAYYSHSCGRPPPRATLPVNTQLSADWRTDKTPASIQTDALITSDPRVELWRGFGLAHDSVLLKRLQKKKTSTKQYQESSQDKVSFII